MDIDKAVSIFGMEALSGDAKIINKRYRQLSAAYHPDRGGDHDMMVMINSARDFLLEYSPKPHISPESKVHTHEDVSEYSDTNTADIKEKPNLSAYSSSFIGFFLLLGLLGYTMYLDFLTARVQSIGASPEVFLPLSSVIIIGVITRLLHLNKKTAVFYAFELFVILELSRSLSADVGPITLIIFSAIAFILSMLEIDLAKKVFMAKRRVYD